MSTFAVKSFRAGTLLVTRVKMQEAGVAKKPSMDETLRQTSDQLKKIRKRVANGGHVDQMQDVDALVGLAKEMADRQLAELESPADENDGSCARRWRCKGLSVRSIPHPKNPAARRGEGPPRP
ncbi:hypothetical protein [Mesorhizobium escarrei]|uniref:hypothetical protein n=1 Tax=Mesorhizobium escarrei TaxID=666018 RepID=UPI0020A769BE|nr:hypothetical protein [Mesorhizobium escarrei]